jgi:VanZ family protein
VSGSPKRWLYYWLPVLLWMGLIFVASSQPKLPFVLNKTVDFITKKAGHVTEYGVLAFLLWRAIPSTVSKATSGHRSKEKGWPALPSLRGAFFISLFYAISDELHQTFVPGRTGRLTDVGFDVLGTLFALALVWWFCRDEDLPKEPLLLNLNAIQLDQLQDGQEGDDDLQA